MRDFAFKETDLPSLLEFNRRFSEIGVTVNGLGNEYLWEKTKRETAYVETLGSYLALAYDSSSYTKCKYATGINIDQTTGAVALSGVFTPTKPPNTGNLSYWQGLMPFYIIPENSTTIYKATSVPSHDSSYMYFGMYAVGSKLGEVTTNFGYVNNPDSSAYPVDDGYTYEKLGMLGDVLTGGTKIETGEFQGTGVNPNSETNAMTLTFGFAPKLVIVYAFNNTNALDLMFFADDLAEAKTSFATFICSR